VYVTTVAVATGFVKLTVNNPLVLGSEALGVVATMLTTELSLSLIVTVAVASAGVVVTVTAVLVEFNVIITFSDPSKVLSSVTVTGIVTLVVFAGIVTVLVIVV
jgi:hypothetical protein